MRKQLAGGVEIRDLASDADCGAAVELQRETWGNGFEDVVPTTILRISQKMGGVLAGAFDESGEMLGFVYGLSGFRYGRRAHWSHMLAVTPEARGTGLGLELKVFQREQLMPLGVDTVYWTYDPLVARNANLNLNRLGALPVEYVEDMYGADTGSVLHSGLGTDRFVVAWPILSSRVDWLVSRDARGEAATRTRATPPFPVDETLADTAWVEAPARIDAILGSSPDVARDWRRRTRAAFQTHLAAGFEVTGFTWREGRPDGACGDSGSAPGAVDAHFHEHADAGESRRRSEGGTGLAGAADAAERRYYYRLERLERH